MNSYYQEKDLLWQTPKSLPYSRRMFIKGNIGLRWLIHYPPFRGRGETLHDAANLMPKANIITKTISTNITIQCMSNLFSLHYKLLT